MTYAHTSDISPASGHNIDLGLPVAQDHQETGKSIFDYGQTIISRADTNTLAAKLATEQTTASLPQISINPENTLAAFAKGLGQGFVDSALQSPIEGGAQTFDHTVGSFFKSDLYDKTKNMLFTPEQATFGSAEWHGQTIGSALGIIPWFLATRAVLRGAAGSLPVTAGLVVSAEDAAANTEITSLTGGKLILEGGATGAAYAGVFKPMDPTKNNYWATKSETMVSDFATFATLTAGSIYFSTQLKSAAVPLIEKFPQAAAVTQRSTATLAGALSGIPAAGVETVTQNLQNGDKSPLSWRELGKNVYTYAIIGGALSALQPVGAKPIIETKPETISSPKVQSRTTANAAMTDATPSMDWQPTKMQEAFAKALMAAANHAPQEEGFYAVSPGTSSGQLGSAAMSGAANSAVFAHGVTHIGLKPSLVSANESGKLLTDLSSPDASMSPKKMMELIENYKSTFSDYTLPPAWAQDIHDGQPIRPTTKELALHFDLLPTASQFKDTIGEHGLGTIPAPFLKGQLSENEVFQKLDSLANALRSLDASLPPQKKSGLGAEDLNLPDFKIGLGQAEMTVSKIGIGEVAHVYKLSVDGQDFAFKVPNDPGRMDVHGALAETAAFVHLSHEEISDLIDFHAANPTFGGWMLTEYVSKPVARSGRSLADVLGEQGFVLGDDWSANRGPGNVVWDLGGIEPKGFQAPKSLDDLRLDLRTPEGQMIVGRKLDNIKDQDELKQALLLCLESPATGGQVARTAARRLIDSSDLADVLSQAFKTPGAAGRAAFELDRLAQTPYITKLFYQGLLNPESRIETAKQIDKLPAEDRKAAFDQAFLYLEVRAMAARSIPSIFDSAERAKAFASAAAYPGADFINYHTISKTRDLTPEEKAKQEQSFEEYFESFGLQTGKILSGERQSLPFDQWWESNKANSYLTEGQAHEISGVWPTLNSSQKRMSPLLLYEFSLYQHFLEPAQWSRMTGRDTTEMLYQIKTGLVDRENINNFLLAPDFNSWLAKNPDASVNASRLILAQWNDLPDQFKNLDAAALSNIARSLDRMNLSDWNTIPPEAAGDIAQALWKLNLYPSGAAQLAHNQDFAQWLKSLPSDADYENLHPVLRMWGQLTPEQKALPYAELKGIAEGQDNKLRLEEIFGRDSQVVQDILAIDSNDSRSVKGVVRWLEQMAEKNPEMLERAKTAVETLAQSGASKENYRLMSLNNRLYMQLYFGHEPDLMEKITHRFGTANDLAQVVHFVQENEKQNADLFKLALEHGFGGGRTNEWPALRATASIIATLHLDNESSNHLLNLQQNGLRTAELNTYLNENSGALRNVKTLIEAGAPAQQLEARHLLDRDNLNNLTGFDKEEIARLEKLQSQGLSATRLLNHLQDHPTDAKALSLLLKRDPTVKQINDFLSLAALPSPVSLKIVEASARGAIRTEDLLAKLKDWNSGRFFRDLVINHVQNGATLSANSLQDLESRAQLQASQSKTFHMPQPDQSLIQKAPMANTFLQALLGIEKQIPREQPIVVLGRDAWPLVPLLRQTGRNAQYFLWSRLQYGDAATKGQWLREIQPNAAVIDTGFAGSIISAIKEIDPGVTGYLMSSNYPDLYPTLVRGEDHAQKVGDIENLAKLICRTQSHTASGGAISRKNPTDDDSDNTGKFNAKSRWNVERKSRELLRGMALPEWDVWRYSQWVGLSATERLGLKTRDDVAKHYETIAQARAQAAAQAAVQSQQADLTKSA